MTPRLSSGQAVFPGKGFVDAVTEATAGRGVDVVLDPVGGDVRAESLRLLAPFGRLAAYGDAAGQTDLVLPLKEVWKHNRSVTGYNIGDLARRSPRLWREHAAALVDLLMAGTVRIDVTDERPLTDVVEVHRRMEAGESRGKTVLRVGG